jgi:hypothetical protein
MVQRVSTVAFEGIEARAVDVQVQVAFGLPAFNMAFPTRQSARPGSACGQHSSHPGSPCRRAGSRSISRPPTSPRRVATTTCRLRSA